MPKIIEYECSLCKKRYQEVTDVSGDLTLNDVLDIHVWEYCCSKCITKIKAYIETTFPGASFIPNKKEL